MAYFSPAIGMLFMYIFDIMFNFFKSKKKTCDLLQGWHIPIDTSYKRINNSDSVQFMNANESRILYFSPLAVTGNQLFSAETFAKMKISVIKTESGWQLKGVKHADNKVLVCVFTYTNDADEIWMKTLFDNINYMGNNPQTTK